MACSDTPPRVAKDTESVTPAQITMQDVEIEERDSNNILWTAHIATSSGDLGLSNAEKITLWIKQGDDENKKITVNSERGKFNFDDETAILEEIHVKDATGGSLKAPKAYYQKTLGTVEVFGPLHFDAQGLTVTAQKGFIYSRENRAEFTGPVVGRYESR